MKNLNLTLFFLTMKRNRGEGYCPEIGHLPNGSDQTKNEVRAEGFNFGISIV